jgi:hypothetical protein
MSQSTSDVASQTPVNICSLIELAPFTSGHASDHRWQLTVLVVPQHADCAAGVEDEDSRLRLIRKVAVAHVPLHRAAVAIAVGRFGRWLEEGGLVDGRRHWCRLVEAHHGLLLHENCAVVVRSVSGGV